MTKTLGISLSSERDGYYYSYTDALPLMFTTLPRLQQDGPLAAVWWRCGHRQWETLPDALTNPDDEAAWHRRDTERRRQRERQEERDRQHKPAQWQPTPQQLPATTPAAAAPVPCERCGQPITGAPGNRYTDAPPEDGRHCPDCRADLAHQQPGLLKALFSRRPGT
ncbi:hypothetical protein AB0D37_42445 [Streptomyces sp. NPDC048384]|uniref:hypothetical protein n=1 Tax=Streptomyces sp. NPDC048384 TaxID=3155487 RepID=UPI00344278B5